MPVAANIFRYPELAAVKSRLVQSATGKELVNQLENVAMDLQVVEKTTGALAVFDPFTNAMQITKDKLSHPFLPIMVAHEGVHRLQHKNMIVNTLKEFVADPVHAIWSGTLEGAKAIAHGKSPVRPTMDAVDREMLRNELEAFEIQAKIQVELGEFSKWKEVVGTDGKILNRNELFKLIEPSYAKSHTIAINRARALLGVAIIAGVGAGANEGVKSLRDKLSD